METMKNQITLTGTEKQINYAASLIEKLENAAEKMKAKSPAAQEKVETKYKDNAILAAIVSINNELGSVDAGAIIPMLLNQRQAVIHHERSGKSFVEMIKEDSK
jgi:hypothetical protein